MHVQNWQRLCIHCPHHIAQKLISKSPSAWNHGCLSFYRKHKEMGLWRCRIRKFCCLLQIWQIICRLIFKATKYACGCCSAFFKSACHCPCHGAMSTIWWLWQMHTAQYAEMAVRYHHLPSRLQFQWRRSGRKFNMCAKGTWLAGYISSKKIPSGNLNVWRTHDNSEKSLPGVLTGWHPSLLPSFPSSLPSLPVSPLQTSQQEDPQMLTLFP